MDFIPQVPNLKEIPQGKALDLKGACPPLQNYPYWTQLFLLKSGILIIIWHIDVTWSKN